jgi:hypothetical protein
MITRIELFPNDKGTIYFATIEADSWDDRPALEKHIAELRAQLPEGALEPNRAGITAGNHGLLTAQINLPAEHKATLERWLGKLPR